MDFDTLLHHAGEFGPYQIFLCICLLVPSAIFSALVYFTQFFIIMVPDHWCHISTPANLNLTEEKLKSVAIPREERDGQQLFSQCYKYNANISALLEGSFNSSVNNMEWNLTHCTDGWDYDFSSLYPTLATDLNWVCDDDRAPYVIQTLFYVGTSIGCIIFGHIADRFGRRPSIVGSYLVACVAGIASGFVSDFTSFAVLRFFVGASIIPLSEDPYVLSLEYIGVSKRTLAIVMWTSGYTITSAICPWIGYAIRDWRLLCIVTSAPLALVILCAKLIPESASWLLTRDRKEEAIGHLRTVARLNKRELPQDINLADKGKAEYEKLTALDLFRTPNLRKHSLILAVAWFVTYCCYHTNTHNTSNLGTDIYESFTFGALVEIPAMLILFFGLDRLGRRWPMIVTMAIAGITGVLISAVPLGANVTFLCFALVMRVTLTLEYNIIMQYSAEVYPTVLRGRGLAFLRFMGTLGLYLSPSIVYLALTNPALPLLISGIMAFFVSVVSLFLPETLNKNLPHSLADGEEFGKDQKILEFPCVYRKSDDQMMTELPKESSVS